MLQTKKKIPIKRNVLPRFLTRSVSPPSSICARLARDSSTLWKRFSSICRNKWRFLSRPTPDHPAPREPLLGNGELSFNSFVRPKIILFISTFGFDISERQLDNLIWIVGLEWRTLLNFLTGIWCLKLNVCLCQFIWTGSLDFYKSKLDIS